MTSLPFIRQNDEPSDGYYSDETGSEYEYDSADPTCGYLFIAHLHDDEYLIDWCRYVEPVRDKFLSLDHTFVFFHCEYPRERCAALWEDLEHCGYQYDVETHTHWIINSLVGYYHAVDMMHFHSEA